MNDLTKRFIDVYDYLLDQKKIASSRDFASRIGISSSMMTEIIKKRSNAGITPIQNTVNYFNEINSEWLLTGSGAMIKTKSENLLTLLSGKEKGKEKGKKPNVKISPPLIEDPINGIPLIPIDAMAGFGVGEMSVMEYEVSRYVVPEFEELHVEFMIRVKGSSMYPKYNSGDLVACKRLVLDDIFFQWNKVYVLDTEQGALIKRVKKGKDQSHILLVSDNEAYDPFELSIKQVNSIAIVLGVIRLE